MILSDFRKIEGGHSRSFCCCDVTWKFNQKTLGKWRLCSVPLRWMLPDIDMHGTYFMLLLSLCPVVFKEGKICSNCLLCVSGYVIHGLLEPILSSSGVVDKLLACGARGPGFESRSRRYDFRDWLSPASKSQYGWNIAKATKVLKTTNQTIFRFMLSMVYWNLFVPLEYKKRLLLRFIHHFKSNLIINMDHMRIRILNPRQWSLTKEDMNSFISGIVWYNKFYCNMFVTVLLTGQSAKAPRV